MDFLRLDRNVYSEIDTSYNIDYYATHFDINNSVNKIDGSNIIIRRINMGYDVPVSILRGNSSFSAIVVFLKNKGLSFKEIAEMTCRDQRTIWCMYNRYAEKIVDTKIVDTKIVDIKDNNCSIKESASILIPLEILRSRTLSVLESIVFYLRHEYGMTITEIAQNLGKNYQTINTVYRRALAKNG